MKKLTITLLLASTLTLVACSNATKQPEAKTIKTSVESSSIGINNPDND